MKFLDLSLIQDKIGFSQITNTNLEYLSKFSGVMVHKDGDFLELELTILKLTEIENINLDKFENIYKKSQIRYGKNILI